MGSISRIEAIDILTEAALHRLREIGSALVDVHSRPSFSDPSILQDAAMLRSGNYNLFTYFSKSKCVSKMDILDCMGIGEFYDDIVEYISFCMRSSFKVLKEVSAEAWETAQFVNGNDDKCWHLFWMRSTEKVKLDLLYYIAYPNDNSSLNI